jgi:hypothetical protein
VFNDWQAFGELLEQLGQQVALGDHDILVIAVDDCSSEQADTAGLIARKGTVVDIRVIRLACNLGHQRAIAVGLVAASKVSDIDAVVVMDSDGEDQPDAVPRLIAAWDKQPGRIVVARRGQRSETFMFRLFYSIYKRVFKTMTGEPISFGNFSLVPRQALQALVHNPAIWNNLAAAIARSRIPYTAIQVKRGPRLAGRSRMNFVSLAVHGLSAISVYTDIVLLRIIVAACVLAGIVMLGLIAVIVVKFGTDWAIPGWASYVAASLIVIFILQPYIAGDVAEVGAGVGGTTAFLCNARVKSWLCIEPDPDQALIIAEKVRTGLLPPVCQTRIGKFEDVPDVRFDTIIYIDVIEHIEDDGGELARACARLRLGGHLVVLVPAFQMLFSALDRHLGHFRRYSVSRLVSVGPAAADLVTAHYLDSVGFLLSLANRLLLKSKLPNATQISFWDSVIIPLSYYTDLLLSRRIGRSAVAVWRRT